MREQLWGSQSAGRHPRVCPRGDPLPTRSISGREVGGNPHVWADAVGACEATREIPEQPPRGDGGDLVCSLGGRLLLRAIALGEGPPGFRRMVSVFCCEVVCQPRPAGSRDRGAGVDGGDVLVYGDRAADPLVVPVCLLVFRASFDWKSLAVCVSLGVVLWSPFLVFQAELLSAETLRRPLLRFFEACGKQRRALVGAALVGLGVPAFLVFGGDVESETVWLLVGAWAALIVVPLVTWRPRGMDGAQGNDRGMRDAAAILAIAFLLCLSLNVMTIPLAEWSFSSRRFFWLTCLLGTAVFSAIWVALAGIRRFGKPIFLAVSLGLTVLAAQKSNFLSDSDKIFKARRQHECYDVLDFLKQDCVADSVTEVSIGYDISFPKWILVNRHYKDGYKIGWDFDVVLEHRYGIHNTNQLPEGVSKDDRYRIVELVKWDPPWDWPRYFNLSDYPRMKLVKRWEKYALLKAVNEPQTGLPASSQQPHR